MDKSPSRNCRNGASMDAEPVASSGSTVAAQSARQRIENGTPPPANPIASIPALQDALLDERNDVIAVINELEDQLDRNQELRENLERELTSTAEKLQTANGRVQELEWQVVTLQTRVESLEQVRQQVAALEEEVSDAAARIQRQNEQLAVSEREKEQLRTDLKTATRQLDELFATRKERDGLRTDYRSLSLKVEELERTQRQMFEERGQLQSRLQENIAAVEQLTAERNQAQLTLRSTEDRVRELAQVQEALVERIDALRNEKQSLQAQLAHQERENARLVEQRQFYECELTSLRNRARSAESALQSVKKAFGEVRLALADTKARAARHSVDVWPRIGVAQTAAVPPTGIVARAEADSAVIAAPGPAGLTPVEPAIEPAEST